MEGKVIGGAVVGAAVGGVQTYALRTWVDKPGEPLFGAGTSYAALGQPSALLGLVGGVIGTGVGLYTYKKNKLSKPVAAALTGYGLSALAGGIVSAAKPVTVGATSAARAPQRVPMGQYVPAPAAAAAARGITVIPTAAESRGNIQIRSLSQ
jgi:hypothetical protein